MSLNVSRFEDKDVVFVGVGQGRSMAGIQTYLESHVSLRSFNGVDKQEGETPLDFLRNYDQSTTIFIKNEAIPGTDMPVPYITAMQLFFEAATELGAMIIGITGTKGKSTTAALTAHVLKHAGKSVVLAGNIGISPFSALTEASDKTVFVLELSSYQLSDMRQSPHISACINLFNDHADWHGSQALYWESKHNIMRYAAGDDLFIYNPDFPELVQWTEDATCRTIAIQTDAPIDMSNAELYGDHNRLNALVVREISRELAIPDDIFMAALQSFTPLRHRMQFVTTKHEVTYIDDAIGMTPESTIASLAAVVEKYGPIGCILLGGQDRGYDFTQLLQNIADRGIPNIVLFPDTTLKMRQSMPADYHPDILETSSMQVAVEFAAAHSLPGSVVLLSAAAPSYSLWRDFEDKGDQFQSAVNGL